MPFTACFNRFNHQSKKLVKYTEYVLYEVLKKKKDEALAQFIMEHVVIRAVSNFEELLMSLVFHSAVKQQRGAVRYFVTLLWKNSLMKRVRFTHEGAYRISGRCLTSLLYASDSFHCSVVSLFHSWFLLSGRFTRKIPRDSVHGALECWNV
jgi:hypothetical protein